MRNLISLKEQHGQRYLIYDFTDPLEGLKILQDTKHLFLDAEIKPIVVIDASFEGETGSYIGIISNSPYHCDTSCGSGLGNTVDYSKSDHAGTFNVLRALHEIEAGLCEYDLDKTVLVYGDANIEKNYLAWLNGLEDYHEIKIKKVFGKCIYGPETLMGDPIERSIIARQYIADKSFKPKHFICLNGTSKVHRFHMVELLFANGWAEKGAISWLNSGGPSLNTHGTSNLRTTNGKEDFTHFQAQTLELDYSSNEIDHSNQFNLPSQYNEACFDIVTESVVDDRGIFITEKTWKPILNETPFIPLGPKHMCAHLRDHFGIKPYTDLFDYSFDNYDYPERLHKLKEDNLERLLNMDINELNEIINSDKMQELLAYNKKQLISNWASSMQPDCIINSVMTYFKR